MTVPGEVEEVWLSVLALLDAEGIPFVVLGGMAVNVWGIPRTTFDIDFQVDLPRHRLAEFLAAADRAGFFFDDHLRAGYTEEVGGRHPLVVIKR